MSSGKGDNQRPVDLVKYRENYDRIFQQGMQTTKCAIWSKPITPEMKIELEDIRNSAFTGKWPKPLFPWEKQYPVL